VLGVMLVASLGFGALPGVIALSLHSIGMLGRFSSRSSSTPIPVPSRLSGRKGASTSQTFCFAILPQVLPRITDLLL